MPEENTTGVTPPVTPPAQQPASGAGNQQVPEGFIEKARFDGLVRKVEELTLANRDLTAQLGLKNSEIEQLKGQLTVKDTEKTVAVSERDKLLEAKVTENSTLQKELEELRAYKLKVETAKSMKRPDLLMVLDSIPAMTDQEAMKSIFTELANFADNAAKEREKQLMAGITSSATVEPKNVSGPSTDEAWMEYINSLPLGSQKRQQAFDQYGVWLQTQHANK